MKRFRLSADRLRPLATGLGSCVASDMITVDGRPVGYAYRESPRDNLDSGWVFMSGYESDDYANEAANLERYDVNTIVNYDPEILPFLGAPAGIAFERIGGTGAFGPAESPHE